MITQFGLTDSEYKLLRNLNTAPKLQRFLDNLPYNMEDDGETLYSPRMVIRHRRADCIEGAIFAAAALRVSGHQPLIVGLHAVRDDCHVIAVFKRKDLWGSVSKSKYTGLRYREPVYRSIRELALSYFDDYYNFSGERTLRGYTPPLNLSRFEKLNWMTTDQHLFVIDDAMFRSGKITPLFPSTIAAGFARVTPLSMRAGELWMRETGIYDDAKDK